MVAVHQVLDTAVINEYLHGPMSGVARDLLRRGLRVQSAARRAAPTDTGRLRNDINVTMEPREVFGASLFACVIGTDLSYASAVHNGSGIYGPTGSAIVPAHGTYLAFKDRSTGTMVFTKSVKGQRGVPFLKDALHAAYT